MTTKKRKSLTGYAHRNWNLLFEGGYIKVDEISKYPICKPEFNQQVKVRITIEEINQFTTKKRGER